MISLIIAADDYAQSAEADAGILRLIEMGSITATSCLTLSPRWQQAAKKITPEIRAKADIGLHLDFTHYNQSLKNSLASLILKSSARLLSKSKIRSSIQHQLDQFENALGTAPDYIDGHQHVHQLPQIREALIEVLKERYAGKMPWIRLAKPPMSDGYKAVIVGFLGANSMKVQLKKANIRHTEYLLGIYNFDHHIVRYEKKLAAWLGFKNPSAHIAALMCHPAVKLSEKEGTDPHFSSRIIEYQVMSDEKFKFLLRTYNIQLVRGNALN